MKKTLLFPLLALALGGCAISPNKQELKPNLLVLMESTGPKIDIAHMQVNRLTQPLKANLAEINGTRMLRLSPSGGVQCVSKDECRHFLQDSKFYVSALGNDSAKVSWQVFTGRRVDFTLDLGVSHQHHTSEVPAEFPSVPDSNMTIEAVVKVGDTKLLRGPYGSEVSIRVVRDSDTK